MDLDVEQADQKRLRYLRGFLITCTIFLFLWLARFFLRLHELNQTTIGILILIGLVIMVAGQALFMVRLIALGMKIRRNPSLNEALNNEQVMHCELRSWKAAFIATVLTTWILALVSFVYPVEDLVFVALTSVIVGAGAYRATFYLLYTSDEN